jgi:hypothetical protein
LYEYKIVFIVVGILSELYLLGQYMNFFHQSFGGMKDLLRENQGPLYIPAFLGLLFKNAINIIELK